MFLVIKKKVGSNEKQKFSFKKNASKTFNSTNKQKKSEKENIDELAFKGDTSLKKKKRKKR